VGLELELDILLQLQLWLLIELLTLDEELLKLQYVEVEQDVELDILLDDIDADDADVEELKILSDIELLLKD